MKVEFRDGLLFTSLQICYQGRTKVIENIVVDTGAAQSILSADVVDDIGIFFTVGDELTTMYGIGGEQYSFRKTIDRISLGTTGKVENFAMDFGILDERLGLNGLMGLDLLMTAQVTIDLKRLTIYVSK